jgi:hypothetical protein
MSTVKEQIVSLGIQFMGISDPLPFEESRMASFIIGMLPAGTVVTKDDIKEACAVLGNTYLYINTPNLVTELTNRINENETTTKVSNILLIGGLILIGLLMFKKR